MKLTCTNYFIIQENFFQENTPKIKMLMFGLAKTPQFGLWDIIPPESQLAFHIYIMLNMRTHLRAKGLVWTRGGGGMGLMFKNIFLFPICIIQKVTILAPK